MMRNIIIIIPLLIICLKVSATNYYVRTGGNDLNSGLSDIDPWANHPWMSTWIGSVELKAGDTIFMRRGDSWIISEPNAPFMTVKHSGIKGGSIVTSAYGIGDSPLIKISTATDYPVIYASGKSYLVFDNLHIQHHSSNYTPTRSGFELAKLCHHIVLTNNEIDNCPMFGIHGAVDCYHITVGDTTAKETATNSKYSNHIHNFGYAGVGLEGVNPLSKESHFNVYFNYIHDSSPDKTGDLAYGIYFSAVWASSAWPKHATARYNRIENIKTWEALDTHGGSYIYFLDNYIENFGARGILLGGREGVGNLPATCDNMYAERNIIVQPKSGWISGREDSFIHCYSGSLTIIPSNIYIRDNTIFYTSRPSSGNFFGIRVSDIDSLIILKNRIFNGSDVSGKAGIYLYTTTSYGVRNVRVSENYICQWGPGLTIMGIAIQEHIDIMYNIISRPALNACMTISGDHNILIPGKLDLYNNTFLGDSYTFNFYSSVGIDVTGSVTFRNNIFGQPNSNDFYYLSWRGAISGIFNCNNNLYWNSNSSEPFYLLGPRNLEDWNKLGYDIHSIFNKDPLFRNLSGSYNQDIDFDLQSNSPAIDKGTYVGLLTDYLGAPINGLPDIGAMENQAGSYTPSLMNSIIENWSPNLLEMNFNSILNDKYIPDISAFNVNVNGSAETLNDVVVENNKVLLTLNEPVTFGDNINISYYKPDTNCIESNSGNPAQTVINQPVTNNCRDPSLPNNIPVTYIDFQPTVFSGFVYELDASGSSDQDNDRLAFSWSVPENVAASSLTSSLIKFLSPVITKPEILTFILRVTDGIDTVSQDIQVTLFPFKPQLSLSKVSVIEASDYHYTDYPNNVADGNLSTLWSIDGDNHWLNISLQEPFKVNYVQIGLLPEQKYESYFDIYSSKDNISWEPVILNAASCGFSGDLQNFEFPAEKSDKDFLYVKFVGHGTSINSSNNYSEVKIFGQPSTEHNSNDGNISLFPNPVKDNINILILEPTSESLLLRIFDFGGRLCTETLLDSLINNIQLPIDLPSGAYIVQILSRNLIIFSETIIVV